MYPVNLKEKEKNTFLKKDLFIQRECVHEHER